VRAKKGKYGDEEGRGVLGLQLFIWMEVFGLFTWCCLHEIRTLYKTMTFFSLKTGERGKHVPVIILGYA